MSLAATSARPRPRQQARLPHAQREESASAPGGGSEPHVAGGTIGPLVRRKRPLLRLRPRPPLRPAHQLSRRPARQRRLRRPASRGLTESDGRSTSALALSRAARAFLLNKSKRRREAEAEAVAVERNAVPPSSTAVAENLEGVSIQRDEAELNAVAASLEDYDAPQSFDTPTDDEPRATPASAQADKPVRVTDAPVRETASRPAPFMPEAPAARHRDFVPPLRTVAQIEAEAQALEIEKQESAGSGGG